MTNGILLVDKPGGITSHDVVARARRALQTKKVGHAGTLDPMATGLLVLGVGRATRLLTYLVGSDKEYHATIRLGQATTTDDAEGEFLSQLGVDERRLSGLDAAIAGLTGEIQQVPSAVSAIKIDGKRAYARVRAGEAVELPARPVTVQRLEIVGRRAGAAADGTSVLDLDVVVQCSSGTYVRAIARDLGAALGTGGHLTALRRSRVGEFDVAQATQLADVTPDRLISLDAACQAMFRTIPVTGTVLRDLRFGRPIPPVSAAGVWAAFDGDHVIGLVENRGEQARPVLVFDPA